MSGSKPLIYFDSCIWIALITAEQRKDPVETAAIAGLIQLMDKKEIIVVSSSHIFAEVLEADFTDQQKAIFDGATKRRSVVQIKDATKDISKLAGEIRSYYKAQRDADPSAIKTPAGADAIHLATAVYYECSSFYTVDAKDKGDSCGLLKLTNPIAGKYILAITKPVVDQAGFAV